MLTNKKLSYSLAVICTVISCDSLACRATINDFYQKNKMDQYDVFSTSPFALRQTFGVNYEADDDCKVMLSIAPRSKRLVVKNTKNDTIRYRFQHQNSDISNHRMLTPLNSDDTEVQFEMRYISGQYAAAGDLTTTLIARLLNGEKELDRRELDVTVNVKPAAAIYFSEMTEQHNSVNIGELNSGKVIKNMPRLRVISTAPFKVEIESENRGRLRHKNHNDTWFINYQFSLNRIIKPLSDGVQQWQSPSLTSALGELYTMEMTLGSAERKPAGHYEDTLYISIAPSLVIAD